MRDLIDDEGLPVELPDRGPLRRGRRHPAQHRVGSRDLLHRGAPVHAGVPYEPYFRGVEAIMDRFDGRPHWGKLHFQTAATLAPRYPEWERFRRRAPRASIPTVGSRNEYLDRVLGVRQ